MTTTERSGSFADRQRDRRARGQLGTAALLDHLERTTPALRAMAERLLAAPGPVHHDPVAGMAEIRAAIAELRTEAPRRELRAIAAAQRDDPAAAADPRLRQRVVEIAAWRRDAERTAAVGCRPGDALVRRTR